MNWLPFWLLCAYGVRRLWLLCRDVRDEYRAALARADRSEVEAATWRDHYFAQHQALERLLADLRRGTAGERRGTYTAPPWPPSSRPCGSCVDRHPDTNVPFPTPHPSRNPEQVFAGRRWAVCSCGHGWRPTKARVR